MLRGSSVGGRLRREEASQSEGRRAVRVGSRPDLWLLEAMTRYERGLVFWNLGGPSQPILLACPVDPGQEADRAERGLAGQLVVGSTGDRVEHQSWS